MVGAAWLATGELDHSRHGDEQQSASRRDQGQACSAPCPTFRRRGTLRGDVVRRHGSGNGRGDAEDVDKGDAEHRELRLGQERASTIAAACL